MYEHVLRKQDHVYLRIKAKSMNNLSEIRLVGIFDHTFDPEIKSGQKSMQYISLHFAKRRVYFSMNDSYAALSYANRTIQFCHF